MNVHFQCHLSSLKRLVLGNIGFKVAVLWMYPVFFVYFSGWNKYIGFFLTVCFTIYFHFMGINLVTQTSFVLGHFSLRNIYWSSLAFVSRVESTNIIKIKWNNANWTKTIGGIRRKMNVPCGAQEYKSWESLKKVVLNISDYSTRFLCCVMWYLSWWFWF